jgi:peptidoglycan hydrolase CwlO-like protein
MSISPNVPSPQESYHYDGATTGTPRWIAVLFIVLFLALVGLAYAGYSIQSRLDTNLSKAQDQNKLLTAELDQANARLADLKGHIDVTEQKMHMTQAELANARSRSESFRKDQVAEDQKLADQLNAAQKESTEKINAVASEVGGAKKDIEATRSDLEATKGRLERASGDMGVMSGLIAHNRDDLEELKRRGDRNYYEFKITKSKTAQKVGPVQVTLNKTDQKKSKYTITVFVDDRSIEKRDKTAGEPVQFYVRGASRMPPYEFVVFEVGKNQITGYLSTPKDTGAPAAAPAAAAKPS